MANQRPLCQGPLTLICLGGGNSKDAFLYRQRYVTTLVENSLRLIYPYLNTSELFSIIDEYSEFKKILPGETIYNAFSNINTRFFPRLNIRKKELSNRQELRLKQLDVYGNKRNLAQRINAIPEDIKERFRKGVINPIAPPDIGTKVSRYPKPDSEQANAERYATEISGIINTFSREYIAEFR